jgi:hypothetical protein
MSRPNVGARVGAKLTDSHILSLKKQALVAGRDIKESDPTTRGLLLYTRYNGTQSWVGLSLEGEG